MILSELWDSTPLWALFLIMTFILLLTNKIGFHFGGHVQKRWPDKSESGVGLMVGAALALLGFLLAFVTSMADGAFNDRRLLLVAP